MLTETVMLRVRWAIGAFGALLLAMTSPQLAHAGPRDSAIPGYRRWIDISSQRPAQDGCTYTTRARGGVVALAAAPDPTGVGGLYLPDGFTVESWLTCGPADVPIHQVHTLAQQAPASREELGQAIAKAAQLEHPVGRNVCSIAPRIDVRDGVPVTTGISPGCEPRGVPAGIGGGPPVD